eukprot:CAMPEP_0168374648 /NCGR_PEP_ID=MMETSP0228-20121227/9408_1 /TAXON_ID=133427 /ORGANISM="Protoceratium reticulatum, Strain CCCM 535 (=CCMP 1889)" /LENGTH=225 /DNA_ID=CAMNT_0008387599 /DNA_START=73 /DNA_END=747 /DNA_ORIENTATION=-
MSAMGLLRVVFASMLHSAVADVATAKANQFPMMPMMMPPMIPMGMPMMPMYNPMSPMMHPMGRRPMGMVQTAPAPTAAPRENMFQRLIRLNNEQQDRIKDAEQKAGLHGPKKTEAQELREQLDLLRKEAHPRLANRPGQPPAPGALPAALGFLGTPAKAPGLLGMKTPNFSAEGPARQPVDEGTMPTYHVTRFDHGLVMRCLPAARRLRLLTATLRAAAAHVDLA